MKKRLVLLWAITLGFGSLQLPVGAKHHHPPDAPPPPPAWFSHYDTDHSGFWNWDEFRQAHYRWLETHPGSEHLSEKELRRRYRELAKEHNGCVRWEDVEKFHAW
jgi:hypothetical protein